MHSIHGAVIQVGDKQVGVVQGQVRDAGQQVQPQQPPSSLEYRIADGEVLQLTRVPQAEAMRLVNSGATVIHVADTPHQDSNLHSNIILFFCLNYVETIYGDCLDMILPPSVKIQILWGKVCLRCKGKTLLSVVNNFFVFKSLLTTPSNVLPLQLKQTFPSIIECSLKVMGLNPGYLLKIVSNLLKKISKIVLIKLPKEAV